MECGHVNRHSFGMDGKPDNLACTLEKGHTGDHCAVHDERATSISGALTPEEMNNYKDAIIDGKKYYVASVNRFWKDIAGTPANEIKPGSPGEELVQYKDPEIASQAKEIAELKKIVADLQKANVPQGDKSK